MISLNKEEALSLASRGLRIFPTNPAKKPLIEDWPNKASSSSLYIEAWWGKWPDALPALPVGAHNLVVIDCDRKPGRPDGVAAFHAICAEQGIDLSNAFAVESPSGGMHYYFSTQTPYGNSRGSLPDGIDVRGKGGYVIAPGATLPSGRAYRVVQGSWDATPTLPEALAAFLKRKDDSETPNLPATVANAPRAFTFETHEARAAHKNECAAVAAAKPGTRNATLNKAAKCLGEFVGAGHLERSKAEHGLWEATAQNGTSEYSDGEATTRATIKSGLDAGIAEPRPVWMQAEPLWYEMIARWIEAFKAKRSSASFLSIDSIQSPFVYASQPIEFAVDDLIPLSAITVISGSAGSGKTSLITKMADAIAEGKSLLGKSPKAPRHVLYLDRENSLPIVKERLMRLRVKADGKFKYWGNHVGADVPQPGCNEIREWVERIEPKPVVFVDSMIAFLESGNENSSNDVRAFFMPLRRLADMGCAVVILHHTGKGESSSKVRGSSDIEAAIDVGYTLYNSGDTRLTIMELKAFKTRIAATERLAFNYSDGEFIPQAVKQAKEDILTFILRNNPGINKGEFERLATNKQIGQTEVRNFIDAGFRTGSILSRKGERNASLLYLPESIALASQNL